MSQNYLMTNFSILGIFNIGLCILLLADGLFIAPSVKTVAVIDSTTKLTQLKRGHYYNYFILTSDNCEYEISEGLYEKLKINETIRIYSSSICKMPLELHYMKEDKESFAKIGQLSSKSSLRIGLTIGLLISVISFYLQLAKRFETSDLFIAFQGIALVTSFPAILFVFIEILAT